MTKERFNLIVKRFLKIACAFFVGAFLATIISATALYFLFEASFKGQIYPGVTVGLERMGGKTKDEVFTYFNLLNYDFASVTINISYKDATNGAVRSWKKTGADFGFGIDAQGITDTAYSIGRNSNFISNLKTKYEVWKKGVNLEPTYTVSEERLNNFISEIAAEIEIEPKDALFQFTNGKVTTFRLSADGQKIDRQGLSDLLILRLSEIEKNRNIGETAGFVSIDLPVLIVKPKIEAAKVNNLGIKELIATGNSYFYDSIPERMFNIELAASRVNGVLVAPGDIFSFSEKIGTISAATGYKKAYSIIKGKTVLDDGGGVCQVSTTLYRAVLNGGLPVVERVAHQYRVSFYEQGGFSPGFDATVYPPSPDFKFKNDTSNWILVQTIFDKENKTLIFHLYGTTDGRKTEISKVAFLSSVPPPEPVYQDDPNLPKGVVKQVDTAHYGAKVSFTRKVTRGEETLIDETVLSNYIPWAAVYLRGTRE